MQVSQPQPTSPTISSSDAPVPVLEAASASGPAAASPRPLTPLAAAWDAPRPAPEAALAAAQSPASLHAAEPGGAIAGGGRADPPGQVAPGRRSTLALLGGVVAVALIEASAALWPKALPEDALRSACATVRAEFHPGDLIALTPPWLAQLGQRELGDLMPVTMLGRADARRYSRIWTLSFGPDGAGALADDLAGLTAGWQRAFGPVTLARYEQKPVVVTYDLTAQLLTAQVAQAAVVGAAAPPVPEVPCLWSGPAPLPHPQRGPAGAFHCPSASVERRVMEIDYRPRYGVVATLGQGQRTLLEYTGIPDADWQGSRLALWLGLHDYHARKTAVGPAQVVVDVDQGTQRVPLTVALGQGFGLHELALPAGDHRPTHTLRIEISAASAANHFVGLHGELRR